MDYRTSEIAEILGISNSGVLYLERRGLIRPTREANGYRSYSPDAVSYLALLRGYERLGFTEREAVEFIDADAETQQTLLAKRKQHLQEQLRLTELMETRTALLSRATDLPHECQFENSPELCWFPIWEETMNIQNLSTGEKRSLREIDITWLSQMPEMQYCSKITQEDGIIRVERGNCLPAQMARENGTWGHRFVESFPSRPCYSCVFDTNDPIEAFKTGTETLRKKGLSPTGEALAQVLQWGLKKTATHAAKLLIFYND